MQQYKPVGVFDSGIGGLTVLRALRDVMPNADYVYLGDTTRLPYGTKSAATIKHYARQMTAKLLDYDISALVVACNTASAYAMDDIRAMTGGIPVVGMIDPAAAQAVDSTRSGHIAVIGTGATIASGSYVSAIAAYDPEIRVTSIACQVLVALAEEGWHDGQIAKASLQAYLDDIMRPDFEAPPDTILLGCTHFPVFARLLRECYGPDIALINSGRCAAEHLSGTLTAGTGTGATRYLVTDTPGRFARLAAIFIDGAIDSARINVIDPDCRDLGQV